MKSHEPILKFLQQNALTISVQVVGILVVVLNLWLSTRIAPFSERVESIDQRVAAIEDKAKSSEPLVERFYKTESSTEKIINDIQEIKEAAIRLEGKIDRLIERN